MSGSPSFSDLFKVHEDLFRLIAEAREVGQVHLPSIFDQLVSAHDIGEAAKEDLQQILADTVAELGLSHADE